MFDFGIVEKGFLLGEEAKTVADHLALARVLTGIHSRLHGGCHLGGHDERHKIILVLGCADIPGYVGLLTEATITRWLRAGEDSFRFSARFRRPPGLLLGKVVTFRHRGQPSGDLFVASGGCMLVDQGGCCVGVTQAVH